MKIASLALVSLLAACGGDAVTINDSEQVGGHSYKIEREDDAPTAGAHTNLVVKPNDASAKPSLVVGWVGLQTDTALAVTGVFDDGDGDFDIGIDVPSPLPAGAMFWFTVTVDGQAATGSAALK